MEKKETIYTILLYVTTALASVLGIALFIGLITVYSSSSSSAYTPEKVGSTLLWILPLFIVVALAIIATGIYGTVIGHIRKENVKVTNESKYKNLLRYKGETTSLPEEETLVKESKLRTIVSIVSYVIYGVCLIACIVYCAIPGHFDGAKDATQQVISAFVHFAPWMLLSLVAAIVAALIKENSYSKSLVALQKILKVKRQLPEGFTKGNNIALHIGQAIIVAVAIVLIVVGALNGGAADVMKKATNICLECIGIG